MAEKIYKIESINKVTRLKPDGTFADFYEITFVLKDGETVGTVYAPITADKEDIKKLVEAEAKKLQEIKEL